MGSCCSSRPPRPGNDNSIPGSNQPYDPDSITPPNNFPPIEEDKFFRGIRSSKNTRKQAAANGHIKSVLQQEATGASISNPHKTKEEIKQIQQALQQHFVFTSLSQQNFQKVISQMQLYRFGARQVIFSQDDQGNNFYVVAQGRLEIFVNGKLKAHANKGESFGELALMHGAKRSATIKTIGNASLWVLSRQTFRQVLQTINKETYLENKAFIDTIPLFQVLSEQQKELVLNQLIVQKFLDRQKIVVQGNVGDSLYIIKNGCVMCTQNGMEIRSLHPGDFFGEQALLYNTERTASITSLGDSTILSLSREKLNEVLGGSLQNILYRNSLRISFEKSRSLRVLSGSQMDRVFQRMEMKSYEPGQKVAEFGQARDQKLLILLKGQVKTSSRRYLYIFDTIGDFSDPTPFQEDFFVDVKSDIASITKQVFEQLIGSTLSQAASFNQAIQILKKVHILRTVPQNTIEKLALVLQIKEYSDQQIIFSQNDPGDTFYIVKHGSVDIFVNGQLKRQIGVHGFFGERSIIMNQNRTATVVAKGAVVCWVLNKLNFRNLVQEGVRTQLLKRIDLQDDSVSLDNLAFVKILGKGMFGNVFLTMHSQKRTLFAMKTVQRKKIAVYNTYQNIQLQRQVLLQLQHPFIVKLVKTFKDEKRLYFLMEFVRGMDLFDVLRKMQLLNNQSSKFYIGCLMLMIEHLHQQNIIYRDLKPENIMIDDNGYPKLIDFGTAKFLQGRTYTVVGTPYYMAPQVIVGRGYGLWADLWSVGIMLYQFLCGIVPFGEEEDDPYKIYQKVIERKLMYPGFIGRNLPAKPLIEQLLNKNPSSRGTYSSIKEHQWFHGVSWEQLLANQMKPPYIPSLESLKQIIEDALRNKQQLLKIIQDEENKDTVQRRHKLKHPPVGWDDAF